jgi:predicted RNase H-like HicB family nuclease
MKFTLAFEPQAGDEAFGVTVPDLPGCYSAGDTAEEAFTNAGEAIQSWCEANAEAGMALPEPRPHAFWRAQKQFKGCTWGLLEVSVEKLYGPAEKINITVPALILRRIDTFAHARGETRSGFLVRAAQEAMRGAPQRKPRS